jgi:Rieske Fe-S protein
MPNRRDFLKSLAAAASSLALLPAGRASAKKLAIPIEKAEKLKSVGGSATLKVKDLTILFVRDSETSVRALDPICTHEKCSVAYNSTTKAIECPCHKSSFDLDGKVAKGPASKPLKAYEASISGGQILITVD